MSRIPDIESSRLSQFDLVLNKVLGIPSIYRGKLSVSGLDLFLNKVLERPSISTG